MSEEQSKSRYDIEQSLAKGGMGEVLEARDLHFGRAVAMKVIRADRDPSHEMRLRFVQEARILSQLEHPNIVPVYDLDKDEQGQVFYTMKKVQGVTLKEVINQLKTGDAETVAKYPLTQLLTVFQKVCDAVAFAHSKGIVHRDLKPENIILGDFGEVLVLDWGLAKVLEEGRARHSVRAEPEEESGDPTQIPQSGAHRVTRPTTEEGFHELDKMPEDAALTLEGQVMGTPQFMAPEQAEGRIQDIDQRTDIFALGGMLYSLLTLRPPTSGTTLEEVLANIKSGYIAPPVIYNKARTRAADGTELDSAIHLAHCPGSQIPDSLSAVAMKAMAVDPVQRYQTVQELQAEITAYQGGFATSAEQAGALRQLWLLVLRHKAVFGVSVVAVVTVLALGTGLGIKITKERNRANATLIGLRQAAPLMRSEIDGLLAAHKFAEALPKVKYVCSLLPNDADSLVLKGNLLQSLLRFDDAEAAYQQALALNPRHAVAQENLQLCRKFRGRPGSKPALSDQEQQELHAAMNRQGRHSEAAALLQRMGKNQQQLFASWKARLRQAGFEERWLQTLELDRDGLLNWFTLDPILMTDLSSLQGLPFRKLWFHGGAAKLNDLTPLKGMPLEDLSIDYASVRDLMPLAGMRLRRLSLIDTKVTDLTPLKGMPLEELRIDYTDVSDLIPLAGMPLKTLTFQVCPVADLAPLAGLPLVELRFSGDAKLRGVRDLRPLKGLPLQVLEFAYEDIRDLAPLSGMPLKDLFMNFLGVTSVADLGPLKGLALKNFVVLASSVSTLEPLRAMPLRRVVVVTSKVASLDPLSGMDLKELTIASSPVTDLTPLKGMNIETLELFATPITSLEPIRGMPVKLLRLDGCNQLRSLQPLEECKELERLSLPYPPPGNIEFLRKAPKLKQITFNLPDPGWKAEKDLTWSKVPPASEFWKAYEARKGKR